MFKPIHFQLTEKSWVDVYKNVIKYTFKDFQEFWKEHPDTKHKIVIFGEYVEIPRFQKLYGNVNYNYSGTVVEGSTEIHPFVEECFKVARKIYPDIEWNGALVNWYKDGSSYIGAHSDDEKDLTKDSPILSFSFGGVRTFRIKKITKATEATEATDKEVEKMDFQTFSSSLIVMGGNMQKEYKHEITKTKKFVEPRINITVRSFVKK